MNLQIQIATMETKSSSQISSLQSRILQQCARLSVEMSLLFQAVFAESWLSDRGAAKSYKEKSEIHFKSHSLDKKLTKPIASTILVKVFESKID